MGTVGNYTVTVTGTSGSLSHSATVTYSVSARTGQPVLLRFKGFDLDDFDNGVGQLQVYVNGNLVVDIPAGLNHLTGSGDYTPYEKTWIDFGPFDITSFVRQGQNTIVFRDNDPADHFGLVRNVSIVQGDTVLLRVPGAKGVSPNHSVTYTFSIPPLRISSFSVTTQNAKEEQDLTFTVSYSGGTMPIKCIFIFSDGDARIVNGTTIGCSVVHDFDWTGAFKVFVLVIGASTSDRVTASLSVMVTD